MTEHREDVGDLVHISDDEDEESGKDECFANKKCSEISDIASKGWRNCSTGFHEGDRKETLKEFLGFSVFQKMDVKEQQAKRRKSAPYKLSSMQSLLNISKENVGFVGYDGDKADKEDDIDTPSSPEDNIEHAYNQNKKIDKLKKWAFADLSNNFCITDKEEENLEEEPRASKMKSPTSSIDLEKLSTSTKIPQIERIRNKYRRHSTDLNYLKNSGVDQRLSSLKQSSIFGDASTIKSDGNQTEKMNSVRPRDQDRNNKTDSLTRLCKKPRLDNLSSMKESKKLIFKRWIQSLSETSGAESPQVRDTLDGMNNGSANMLTLSSVFSVDKKLPANSDKSHYLERVLISSRETSQCQDDHVDRLLLDENTKNSNISHLQDPSAICKSPKMCKNSLIPPIDPSRYEYVDTIVTCESKESPAEVSPYTVTEQTPHISTPSSFCAQSASQPKNSRSPIISTASSSNEMGDNCDKPPPMPLTAKRKNLLRKSKLPVCSTPYPNATVSGISSKSPDFSLIEAKVQLHDNKHGEESYRFGSMKRSDTDAEIDEDFDNGTQASVHISSAESESSDNGNSEVNVGGQRCSEWLQNVNWRKSCVKSDMNGEHLDTKELKYQSLIPGGLAECAWKLEKREKSERAIWSYKKLKKLKSSLHKALTMKINAISVTDSILMSKCSLLKLPSSQTSSTSSENGEFRSKNGVMNLKEGAQCFLILKSYTAKDMQLKPGNVLHVFPPWQTLNIPSLSSPVILCAFFVQEEEEVLSTESNENEVSEEIIFLNSDVPPGPESLSSKTDILHKQKQDGKVSEENTMKSRAQHITKSRCQNNNMALHVPESASHNENFCDASEKDVHYIENHIDEVEVARLTFTGALESTRRKELSVAVRVQRIWCHVIPESLVQHKLKASHNTATANSLADARYSLLLQDSNLQFCELQLIGYKPESPQCLRDLIDNGEGKCYKFDRLRELEPLMKTRHPLLFSYLRRLTKKEQDFSKIVCYKASMTCEEVSISSVPEESCPPFAPYCVESLDRVFAEHNSPYQRITCAVGIVSHAFDTFYLVDPSVKDHEVSPYVRMKFCPLSFRPASVCVGSLVAVVDAVMKKGVLYVDRYSRVTIVSPLVGTSFVSSSQLSNRLGISSKDVIALSFLDSSKCTWKSLSTSSGVADIVQVQGKVVDVDEENAVCWLECGVCAGENLFLNSQKKMFCTSCNAEQVAPKMLMNMSVTIEIPKSRVSASVELTSATTKKVMKIPDGAYQPQCNITDILGKVIGPMFCYVKTKKLQGDVLKFELAEVHVR